MGLVTNFVHVFPLCFTEFTGSNAEEGIRERSRVETEKKNGREFGKFKSGEGSHSSARARMGYS